MSKWVEVHKPCPCGKSSDAYSINDNGWGKCFSCNKSFKENEEVFDKLPDTSVKSYDYYEHRNINRRTFEHYNVVTEFRDEQPFKIGFVYPNNATKFRSLEKKEFWSEGPMGQATLFGMDKFDAGSRPYVLVTEGEYDALSAYQMLGRDYACVSIRSSSSAVSDMSQARDYLNAFDKIVLCFDSDEVGQKATKAVSASGVFDFNKVYHAKLGKLKDASEYLQNSEVDAFKQLVKTARRFTPDNIVNQFDDIRKLLDEKQTEQVAAYPFSELNEATYGLRRGEFILMKGLQGIGKTEICRSIIHHTLKEFPIIKQATIFLEESESVTVKGVATYELGQPAMLPDSGLSDDDVMNAYMSAVTGDDKRLYIHKHFSSEDEGELIDSIRFLVSVLGVDVIYLDNLTMLVTGREGEDERLRIDRTIRRLRDLVNELNFCLFLVAHVNDDGQTRGSRLPDKLCNTVLHVERNKDHYDDTERRTTKFILEKVRLGGKTGPAGKAFFDRDTFRLRNFQPEDDVRLV